MVFAEAMLLSGCLSVHRGAFDLCTWFSDAMESAESYVACDVRVYFSCVCG